MLAVALALGACADAGNPGAPPIPGADRLPPALRLEKVGRYDFTAGASDDPGRVAEELSGIARLHDSLYVAVSDQHAWLHFLVIDVDSETGAVRGARLEAPLELRDRDGRPLEGDARLSDREGVVVDPAGERVWVAQERTGAPPGLPAICAYGLTDGTLERIVDPRRTPGLSVFLHARPNLGFESLTRTADGRTFWTANEEALDVDGPTPTASRGSVVRLQALDADLKPVAQVAYVADPVTGPIRVPPSLAGEVHSGVSDLLAVDGGLLVLERMFAGDANGLATNRIRIYEVDLRGATDVSRGAPGRGLAGRRYRRVRKTLLAEMTFPLSNSNFEGITLGPRLAGGDRSVLLIADNNAGTRQALFALRLVRDDDPAESGAVQEAP